MAERTMVIDAEALDRIGLEVDMRLTDVWSMLFERTAGAGDGPPDAGGDQLDVAFVGWLLRLAYVTAYWDALGEADRGNLCRRLGYPVPERDAPTRETASPRADAGFADA